MARPGVDVVVPFAGSEAGFTELLARLDAIEVGGHDRIIVVVNRASIEREPATSAAGVTVLRAVELPTSYYARNRGAAAGRAEWIVFVDADVEWKAALLDAYFEVSPAERTAVMAGAIVDAPVGDRATVAERYAVNTATMSAANTLERVEHPPYAQTANCAVRRTAFESAGGFTESVRSGGDADLCFRLQAAGWQLEARPRAVAIHRNRSALGALLAQKARHGAGAQWLEDRHPGAFPRRRLGGLALWSLREVAVAFRPRTASSDGGTATKLVGVAAVWAFELGRLRSNVARPAAVPRSR